MFGRKRIRQLEAQVEHLDEELCSALRAIDNIAKGTTDAQAEAEIKRMNHPERFAAIDADEAWTRKWFDSAVAQLNKR